MAIEKTPATEAALTSVRIVGPSLLLTLALEQADRVIPSSIKHTLDELGLGTAIGAPDIDYILFGRIEEHHHALRARRERWSVSLSPITADDRTMM